MSIVRSTLRAGTRDLPDVPPCVQYLIGCFLTPILAWLTTLVYRQVLTRCADHPLLLIAQHYDLRAVVTACAAYQHRSGPGAPPTFSVDQLVRAELVRAWAASCTDPELEWLLASNLIVRWFVGLPLVGPTPDHRTLNRLHAWMATTTPTILFADLVTFLDQVDPQPAASTPQIVDTFARASPAAPTVSVIDLLGQLLVRLVAAWPQTIPLPAVLATLDLPPLRYRPRWHTADERQQRLQTVVTTAEQTDTPPPDDPSTQLWNRIHDTVFECARTAVPYHDEQDAWYGPNAAVWQARFTAALVGCMFAKYGQFPVPERQSSHWTLQHEWEWFVEGHWPCSYFWLWGYTQLEVVERTGTPRRLIVY